ncbi:MAG: ribosome maturation factor RimM [Bacteroidota bacterium]
MDKNDCIKIGFISKSHGFKGEVKIIIDDAVSDSIKIEKLKTLLLEINNQLIPFFIEETGGEVPVIIVLFEDIDSQDKARKLIDKSVYIPTKELPKAKKKQDDLSSLIGFMIVDKTFGELSSVLDILEYPQQLLLQINYNSKEVLIPLVAPLVTDIDKKIKVITVDLPEGFLDI